MQKGAIFLEITQQPYLLYHTYILQVEFIILDYIIVVDCDLNLYIQNII